MAMTRISRRTVLAVAPAAALLPFLPVGPARAAAPSAFAVLVASVLSHRAGAAAIGAAYLKSRPGERDAAVLSTTLQADLSVPPVASEEIGRAMFRESVRRAARRDSRRGEVVTIDGQILSRTEARLCALVLLTRTGV